MRSAGFNTVTASNGVEAVDAHRRHNPPLILMDLSMPVMDGFEASRRIFAAVTDGTPPPIILAVSANVTPEWKTSCYEIGMEDFVEKPIDFDSLVARMKTLYARMGY